MPSSRVSPLTLRSVALYDSRTMAHRSEGLEVLVNYRIDFELMYRLAANQHKGRLVFQNVMSPSTPNVPRYIDPRDAYLEDVRGRRWRCDGAYIVSDTSASLRFGVLSQPLPTRLEGLKFHAVVCVGDLWPLIIDAPVRQVRRRK